MNDMEMENIGSRTLSLLCGWDTGQGGTEAWESLLPFLLGSRYIGACFFFCFGDPHIWFSSPWRFTLTPQLYQDSISILIGLPAEPQTWYWAHSYPAKKMAAELLVFIFSKLVLVSSFRLNFPPCHGELLMLYSKGNLLAQTAVTF